MKIQIALKTVHDALKFLGIRASSIQEGLKYHVFSGCYLLKEKKIPGFL